MSRDAFSVSLNDTPRRIEVAAELMQSGEAWVLLEDALLMRFVDDRLVCAVLDPFSDGPDSPERFEQLIKSGQVLLNESPFAPYATNRRVQWEVIHDYGTGSVRRWPRA